MPEVTCYAVIGQTNKQAYLSSNPDITIRKVLTCDIMQTTKVKSMNHMVRCLMKIIFLKYIIAHKI